MKSDRYIDVFAVLVLGVCLALAFAFTPPESVQAANTVVHIRPASPVATVTPKPDAAQVLGLPVPVTAPTCVYGEVSLHGDSAGCVYACASNIRRIVSGADCVFSTPDPASTPVAP